MSLIVLSAHDEAGHFLLAPRDMIAHLEGEHGTDISKFDLDPDAARRYIESHGIDITDMTHEEMLFTALHERLHDLSAESHTAFATIDECNPWQI